MISHFLLWVIRKKWQRNKSLKNKFLGCATFWAYQRNLLKINNTNQNPPNKENQMSGIRKEIVTFLIVLTVLSVVFNTLIITGGGEMDQNIPYAIGLMFSPAFAGLLTHFIFNRTLRGFGWKWGKTRYQILAYAVPMLYLLISYGLILLLGLGKFNSGLASEFTIVDIIQSATLSVLVNCVIVAGEEISWRGFLLPKLVTFGSVIL